MSGYTSAEYFFSMKLFTEDYSEDIDPFLQLLLVLWNHGLSINPVTARGMLNVNPVPEKHILQEIFYHYEQLAHWLPGVCDNCDCWVMQRTEVPYGAHAVLCPPCKNQAIQVFEKHGWPKANWYPGEE